MKNLCDEIGGYILLGLFTIVFGPFAFFSWLTDENPNHRGFYDQYTTRTGYFPGS